MTNALERMKRLRTTLEEVPRKKILRKKFVALQSLKFGVSIRTIDNYLQTLIDAEKVFLKEKMIWRKWR